MICEPSQYKKACEYIADIFAKGKNVIINQYREKRSISQNNLYWLWLTCIEQETGNDRKYLHIFFAKKYLPITETKVFNEIIYDRTSTQDLNTLSFKHYLDKIQIYSNTDIGIELPNPEDEKFKYFKEHYSKFL